ISPLPRSGIQEALTVVHLGQHQAAVELLPAIEGRFQMAHLAAYLGSASLETLDPGYHPLDGWILRPTAALYSSSSCFLPAFELVTLDWAPSLSADERVQGDKAFT